MLGVSSKKQSKQPKEDKEEIRNLSEEVNELEISGFKDTSKNSKIDKLLSLNDFDKELFCIKYPKLRTLKCKYPSTMNYYIYAYIFFESLCFFSIKNDIINDLIRSLSSNGETPSTNFPFISPFYGGSKYLKQILKLLKGISDIKGEDQYVDLASIADGKFFDAFVLLSKSLFVNHKREESKREFIRSMNAGEESMKNLEDCLISGYKLGFSIYFFKHKNLAKQIIEASIKMGKRRWILFYKDRAYIFYRNSELKLLLGDTKDSGTDKRFRSLKQYTKALCVDNKKYIEELKIDYEKKLEKTKKNSEAGVKGILKCLEKMGDVTFNNEPDGALYQKDVERLKQELTLLSKNSIVKEIDKAEIIIDEILTSLKNHNPLVMIRDNKEPVVEIGRLQWTIVVDECKKCKNRKDVVKFLKNCSKEVCAGVLLCYSCFKNRMLFPLLISLL